jgi:hypothetical protein
MLTDFKVFDTTFCGDWAGATFTDPTGAGQSCTSYVAANPGAYTDAYWEIDSIRVFNSS